MIIKDHKEDHTMPNTTTTVLKRTGYSH